MNPNWLEKKSIQSTYSSNNGKSRVLFIILALFLGWFGVHNFFAGYIGRAITQALITIFLGWLVFPLVVISIWNIGECFLVNSDANGIPFS